MDLPKDPRYLPKYAVYGARGQKARTHRYRYLPVGTYLGSMYHYRTYLGKVLLVPKVDIVPRYVVLRACPNSKDAAQQGKYGITGRSDAMKEGREEVV